MVETRPRAVLKRLRVDYDDFGIAHNKWDRLAPGQPPDCPPRRAVLACDLSEGRINSAALDSDTPPKTANKH
jgi:hypothetical protein